MKLSVIVCTRNRERAIIECLNSIAVALANATPLDAEIVIVDNGSTDNTNAVLKHWAANNSWPTQILFESGKGKGRALNRALRVAKGSLLAITDDDCRFHPSYINDALRYDAADTEPILRGGRVELGDSADLPFTINTSPHKRRWSLAANSARTENVATSIGAGNMVMRRELVERIGDFDECFGPGSEMGGGEDADYIFRAYVTGAIIEYVPDMIVYHFHGRRTAEEGRTLFRRYLIAAGGLNAKYIFRYPKFCLQTYWNFKNAIQETRTGKNTFLPEIDFSHWDTIRYIAKGALLYTFRRRHAPVKLHTQRP